MVRTKNFFVFGFAFLRPVNELASHCLVRDSQNPSDLVHRHRGSKELSDHWIFPALVLTELKCSCRTRKPAATGFAAVSLDFMGIAFSHVRSCAKSVTGLAVWVRACVFHATIDVQPTKLVPWTVRKFRFVKNSPPLKGSSLWAINVWNCILLA